MYESGFRAATRFSCIKKQKYDYKERAVSYIACNIVAAKAYPILCKSHISARLDLLLCEATSKRNQNPL